MDERGLDRADPAEQRCRDPEHMHDADTDKQVFLNGAVGATSDGAGGDDLG